MTVWRLIGNTKTVCRKEKTSILQKHYTWRNHRFSKQFWTIQGSTVFPIRACLNFNSHLSLSTIWNENVPKMSYCKKEEESFINLDRMPLPKMCICRRQGVRICQICKASCLACSFALIRYAWKFLQLHGGVNLPEELNANCCERTFQSMTWEIRR